MALPVAFACPDDEQGGMDSRSEPRLETNELVQVTVLGACDTRFLGRITNSSSRGIGILADQPASLGSAVKLEWGHTLLLGEVCHCRREGDGYAIGLELEHALYHTEELARLAAILLEEDKIPVDSEKAIEK